MAFWAFWEWLAYLFVVDVAAYFFACSASVGPHHFFFSFCIVMFLNSPLSRMSWKSIQSTNGLASLSSRVESSWAVSWSYCSLVISTIWS